MNYRVKNWKEFQHYKERSPTWIKLHKALLDDFDFHCLPVASRALAPMLWLLASESKDDIAGSIDGSDEKIAFRLRLSVKELREAIKPLINKGFIDDASSALAEAEKVASPEKETEEELERETEGEVSGLSLSATAPPSPPSGIKFYLGEKNQTEIPDRALVGLSPDFDPDDEWAEYATKMGFVNGHAVRELEKFIGYWTVSKGAGKKKTKRGWRQAWANWLEIAAKRA